MNAQITANAWFDFGFVWFADYYLLATLLLTVVLVATLVVRQPARRLAIAWAAAGGLLMLALLVALPGWSVVHLLGNSPARLAPPAPTPTVVSLEESSKPPRPSDFELLPTYPIETASEPTVVTSPHVAVAATPDPVLNLIPYILLPLLAGSTTMLVWLGLGAWQTGRLVRGSTTAPPEVDRLLAALSKNATHRPTLRLSERVGTGVALGLRRPMILLPQTYANRHDAVSLRSVLAHELAHVQNGDLWLLAALRALQIILWAHPLYWLVRRRVRLDQETLADAAAAEITSRETYAEQLVGWARDLGTPRPPTFAGAVGLWETRSQLRKRITLLLDHRLTILRDCSRRWKLSAVGLCALVAVALSLVTMEPGESLATESHELPPMEAEKDATLEEKEADEETIDEPFEPEGDAATTLPPRVKDYYIVISKHMMLLDGKKVITWPELEDKIALLKDTSKVHMHYYMTRGAREAGQQEFCLAEHQRLQKKFGISNLTIGGLWPRADWQYDRLETALDLLPDSSHAMVGRVVDANGDAVVGAEVLLIEPVDESISYKGIHMAFVDGRVRNRLEHVMTVSDKAGLFTVYPSSDDVKYYLLALHPDSGFALVKRQGRKLDDPLKLVPWGSVRGRIVPQEGYEQSASMSTGVREGDGWPGLTISQYASERKEKLPVGEFRFPCVPPDLRTTLQRSVRGEQGVSYSLPGRKLQLKPGEQLREDMGPMTEEEQNRIERLKREMEERASRRE